MIRVGLIAAKLAARWPKVETTNEVSEEVRLVVPGPATPEEITAAVAAAEKRYKKGHRRRVCLEDPSGCCYERNVDSMRQ